MTSERAFQRTGTSAAQRLQTETRERVLERIKNINWELEAIHKEMGLTGPQAAVARQLFGEDGAAVQVLAHFKEALDRLRRTVWSCLEQSQAGTVTDAEREQAVRLQRVTEVMRKLSPQPLPGAATQPDSFFDRLNVVIDTYMETRPLRAARVKNSKA